MNESPDEYINTPDFKGFKIMHNGPNYFTGSFPRGKINIRSRAGASNNWRQDGDAFVSLNLREHEYHIDAYIFSILDLSHKKLAIVGWILFDELLQKAEAILEDETVYLTIPIKELRPVETLLDKSPKIPDQKATYQK